MRIDAGILPDSVRFFHEPDAFTEQALYHTPHVGVYHCDSQYNFSRAGETCLDICQAIFVDHGALTVRYREQEITASPGMLILLDCREPHEYFAVSPEIRFRWFHIVGASSFAYIAHIIQSHGFVIQTAKNADIERFFAQIITDAKQDAAAYAVSAHVEQLLAGLASLAAETNPDAVEQSMIDSAQYIEAHYAEKEAKVPALAARAALSTCYYLRKFKEYHGVTPHQYLQSVRLRAAKEQLTVYRFYVIKYSSCRYFIY